MKYVCRNFASVEEAVSSNLGIKDVSEIKEWMRKFCHDEYRIKGIPDIANAIRQASKQKTPIFIVGDYDCDGICSTAILYDCCKRLGASVSFRIPSKRTEGYGINPVIIEEAPKDALIITVDNGIAAHGAISDARRAGHKVIVVDHHQGVLDESGRVTLPDADIIVDPVVISGSADFSDYCGAGLSFKIARCLFGNEAGCYVPIATIATIADVVSLKEENHALVRNGLSLLNKSPSPGIKALLNALGIEEIDESAIGFKIAPCLNALERMGDGEARNGVELLLSSSYKKAASIASHCVAVNESRKLQTPIATAAAEKEAREQQDDVFIIVNVDNVNEGVIGIVAGRLKDRFGKPCLVFTGSDMDDGYLKGSGRGLDGFDITSFLKSTGAPFMEIGGHEGACGVTIMRSQLSELREAVRKASKNVVIPKEKKDTLLYDLEAVGEQLPAIFAEQQKFKPYGQGNPLPVIKVPGFKPTAQKAIGSDGIKLESGNGLTAVGFGLDVDETDTMDTCDLYGTLSINTYKGRRSLQMVLMDVDTSRKEEESSPEHDRETESNTVLSKMILRKRA